MDLRPEDDLRAGDLRVVLDEADFAAVERFAVEVLREPPDELFAPLDRELAPLERALPLLEDRPPALAERPLPPLPDREPPLLPELSSLHLPDMTR